MRLLVCAAWAVFLADAPGEHNPGGFRLESDHAARERLSLNFGFGLIAALFSSIMGTTALGASCPLALVPAKVI